MYLLISPLMVVKRLLDAMVMLLGDPFRVCSRPVLAFPKRLNRGRWAPQALVPVSNSDGAIMYLGYPTVTGNPGIS